jgi:ATP-binding cassette subfamily B protein
MSPGVRFVPEKGQKKTPLKFLPLLFPHKKDLIIISLASALLIVLGIVTSYYYKYIAGEVIISKAAFTLTAFSIGAITVTITQSIIESLRGIIINYFAFKTDLQLNISYITHILKLPLSFFDFRKTGDILSRLTDVSKIREMLSGTALSLVLDCVLIVIIGPVLFKINDTLFAISIVNVVLMSISIFFFARFFRTFFGKLRKKEAKKRKDYY